MKKKIISNKDLKQINLFKKPLVFVPMASDLLHHGHIRILKRASNYGNVIVGLMTDKGIKSYKKNKPILTYKQRKEIISSIKFVDYIMPLEGLLYVEIALILKIDFFVHGTDWKKGPQSKVRKKLIMLSKQWGGKVIDVSYTKNISSKKIKKILLNHNK